MLNYQKSISLLCPGTLVSYRLVEDLQKKACPKLATELIYKRTVWDFVN